MCLTARAVLLTVLLWLGISASLAEIVDIPSLKTKAPIAPEATRTQGPKFVGVSATEADIVNISYLEGKVPVALG